MSVVADEITPCIDTEEDEQQYGKSPQRRPTITEERQRYAYHRGETEHHSHIYEHMEEEYAQDTISVNTSETMWLSS